MKIKMKTYNKLVRDKIPDIIKKDGVKCKTHIATDDEFRILLFAKLKEEVNEFMQNVCAEEIADILEVIEAIARVEGIGIDKIKEQKITKKSLRGGFDKKIILESTDDK
jgi:predicted house-cleaning noncanonical NTP pyrophosphatase (MazG superfamily)